MGEYISSLMWQLFHEKTPLSNQIQVLHAPVALTYSRWFGYAVDVIILANGILIVIDFYRASLQREGREI